MLHSDRGNFSLHSDNRKPSSIKVLLVSNSVDYAKMTCLGVLKGIKKRKNIV